MIAKEKGPLQNLVEILEIYFMEISDKLLIGDVLLRRNIELEGKDIRFILANAQGCARKHHTWDV